MEQILQVAGALLILVAFAAVQTGRWKPQDLLAVIFNAVGASVLTVLAFRDKDWGFVMLEAVWTLVSVAGLLNKMSSRSTDPSPDP